MGSRAACVAALLGIAAAGCRPSSIYVPAVQMQLAAHPTEVRAGDPVRIAVTVTNPHPDTVLLEFGPECRVSFTVLDASDRAVGPRDADACMAPGGRLVLAPGQAWQTEAAWRALGADGAPLAPGAYAVAAALGDHDSVVRGRREYKMGSGAERVPVRVLPAAP